ncbi:MAG: DUF61 family protein [Candidatus Hadarchaeales archaeon]
MNMEKLLEYEMRQLNAHLPARKLSLEDALSMKKPGVPTKDGSFHSFERGELEFIAGLLSEEERKILQLPILLMIDPKLGRGATKVSGACERKIIEKILGRKIDEKTVLYRPEVAAIRKKLPTTTQYFFMP